MVYMQSSQTAINISIMFYHIAPTESIYFLVIIFVRNSFYLVPDSSRNAISRRYLYTFVPTQQYHCSIIIQGVYTVKHFLQYLYTQSLTAIRLYNTIIYYYNYSGALICRCIGTIGCTYIQYIAARLYSEHTPLVEPRPARSCKITSAPTTLCIHIHVVNVHIYVYIICAR